MPNFYLRGTDMLGAHEQAKYDRRPPFIGAAATSSGASKSPEAGSTYVLVQVTDMPALLRAQGGAVAALGPQALSYEPTAQLVRAQVYQALRDKLAAALKEQNVAADVSIAYQPSTVAPPSSHFLGGIAIGAGVIGVGWLLTKLIRGHKNP